MVIPIGAFAIAAEGDDLPPVYLCCICHQTGMSQRFWRNYYAGLRPVSKEGPRT
jgi:hypothetical protein